MTGGVIQLMYSRQLVTRVAEAMKVDVITVNNVTSFFTQLVMISECSVGSYLAVDGSLVTVITAPPSRSTILQAAACIEEAKRIVHLLSTQSPVLTSYLLTLSFVNVTAAFANVRPTQPVSSLGHSLQNSDVLLVTTASAIVVCLTQLRLYSWPR